MMIRARRPLLLAGRVLKPGDVVDTGTMGLPVGRVQRLVDTRYCEYAVLEESTGTITCQECGRSFETAHALSIHKGRTHRDTTEE